MLTGTQLAKRQVTATGVHLVTVKRYYRLPHLEGLDRVWLSTLTVLGPGFGEVRTVRTFFSHAIEITSLAKSRLSLPLRNDTASSIRKDLRCVQKAKKVPVAVGERVLDSPAAVESF